MRANKLAFQWFLKHVYTYTSIVIGHCVEESTAGAASVVNLEWMLISHNYSFFLLTNVLMWSAHIMGTPQATLTRKECAEGQTTQRDETR